MQELLLEQHLCQEHVFQLQLYQSIGVQQVLLLIVYLHQLLLLFLHICHQFPMQRYLQLSILLLLNLALIQSLRCFYSFYC